MLFLFWYWQRLKHFFRDKTFLFFKIKGWNFQVQFEIEFHETSHNFNSFSLFRQLLFSFFFFGLSDWVETLWGFMKFFFKLILKVSAIYLQKQKSFIPKKMFFKPFSIPKQKRLVYWRNFAEGFGCTCQT